MRKMFVIKAKDTITGEVFYIEDAKRLDDGAKIEWKFKLNERTEFAKIFPSEEAVKYVHKGLTEQNSVYVFEMFAW